MDEPARREEEARTMNHSRSTVVVLAAALIFTLGSPSSAHAVVVQIMNLTDPLLTGGTYQTGTTNMEPTIAALANGTTIGSLSDGTLTVGFSNTLTKGKVGQTFGTWGSPPDTESATPDILNTFGNPNVTTRTLTFSQPLTVFGFEAEGGDFSPARFTLEFLSGATSLGTISRTIVGNAGARILAGESPTAFDHVIVTDTLPQGDNSFAIAQPRYAVSSVPEPATLTLFGAAVVALYGCRRRRE
jgi:hypothetical protein